MPHLRIFVEDIVALLGAMTDTWVRKLVCGRILKLSNDQVKFPTKIEKQNLLLVTFR